MGLEGKGMEQGVEESNRQETALKKEQVEEEAGRGYNVEQVEREGAESNPQEHAVEEGNQQIEGRNQENAPNPDDLLIPDDNELLNSLSEFLENKNRGYPSRSEYPVIIEYVREKLHPEISPRRIMERLETLRENFMAAPLFEVSRRIWKEGGRPFSSDERRVQENVEEEGRGREESVDQENPQKQVKGQEGNDFPADIDLLKTLLEFLKVQDRRPDFTKLDDYQAFLLGFAYECYPERDEIRLITRILELKGNFLARERIWGVSPGRLTARAGPSSPLSDRERRALKKRITEAIEMVKWNHFQMTHLEINNVATWLDALFTPSSGREEDVGIVTVPKRLWSQITANLQDRSYTAPQNRTDAERNLEKGKKPIEQSSEDDARGKQPVHKSSEGDDETREKPDNEDDDKMSKKPANVEVPRLIAPENDFLNSLNSLDMESQDELEALGFVMSPKRSTESHGESIPAGDSSVVVEEGRLEHVSDSPNASENVPDSGEGTSGSGGDAPEVFSDQQSNRSGEDADKEEKKPGDDESPKKKVGVQNLGCHKTWMKPFSHSI